MVSGVHLGVTGNAERGDVNRPLDRTLVDRGLVEGATSVGDQRVHDTDRDQPAGGHLPHPCLTHFLAPVSSVDSAAMKASWGTSTRPTIFIRFLPSFCFSNSLRLRVMSPP